MWVLGGAREKSRWDINITSGGGAWDRGQGEREGGKMAVVKVSFKTGGKMMQDVPRDESKRNNVKKKRRAGADGNADADRYGRRNRRPLQWSDALRAVLERQNARSESKRRSSQAVHSTSAGRKTTAGQMTFLEGDARLLFVDGRRTWGRPLWPMAAMTILGSAACRRRRRRARILAAVGPKRCRATSRRRGVVNAVVDARVACCPD